MILCIYKGKYIMKKTNNIILRVDEEVKNRFQDLAERNNVTMSSVLNECMIEMINKDNIPIRIKCRVNAKRNNNRQGELTIANIKRLLEESINEANLNNKIKKVYLFGSYSRGEETKNSDIDIRIEHMNDFDLFDLGELSYLFEKKTGKNVDVATQSPSKMDPAFYNSIRKDEICIYEKS